MLDSILSVQHGLIMDTHKNVTNYDVQCAQLLTENVLSDEKSLIPVLNNTYDKYVKKIDDSFAILADMSVDVDKISEFFTKIQHTEELSDIPLSTPIKNVNDIGRIKPEYLNQIVKDSASTINDIINGKITIKELMSHFSSDLAIRIKRQLVISNKPVADIKSYIRSQEKANIVPMDSQAIMTLCIPFLRSFNVKKMELQSEIAAVKVAINSSYSLMKSYTDTAVSLKNKGQISGSIIDTLNYYLYNQNRLLDEVISYMVFCLITKIDIYTFNVNSYAELYRKVLKYNPEGSDVYHESVYEYSMATADIDSVVNSIIYGNVSSLTDYAERTYNSAKSLYNNRRTVDKITQIDFILDQHMDKEYPYRDLFDTLDVIESGIKKIPFALKDKYASPENILEDAGFKESLTSRFALMISKITDLSRYFDALNNGKAKSSVLFQILAEMRNNIEIMDDLGGEIKEVYDEIRNLIVHIERNTDNEIPNELVRSEMHNFIKNIERDYRNFLGLVVQNIIQRSKSLEDEVFTLVEALDEQIDIDECDISSDTNYNVLAIESCMEMADIFAKLQIESEMIKFRNAKFMKEYGIVMEAENEQTQEQTQNGKKETPSPSVTVDSNKQTPADVAQNNEAAKEGKEDNKPENKKKISDRIKELIEKIKSYFDKIIPDFVNGITGQLQSNSDFLKQYKDSILNRSFNGITLNIFNYFNLNSTSILEDIGKVSAAISQISDSELAEYSKPEVLQQKIFGFLRVMPDMTFDDFLRIYYKVGYGQKEVKKISISNTELKKRTAEMIEFCEDFYINSGYKNVQNELNKLRNSLSNKVNSLKNVELTDEQSKALQAISREVMVFTGSVLTGFRNRAHHYMFAIRKLVPKTAKPVTEETPENTGKSNQNNEPVEGESTT